MAISPTTMFAESQLTLSDLRVSGLTNPQGIDQTPRFSWITQFTGYNFHQKSYQIVVTDDEGKKVWDSKEVSSAQQSGITYAGSALKSCTTYHYTVTVTGAEPGQTAQATGTFETAFLKPTEWKAKWIHARQSNNACVTIPIQSSRMRYLKLDATKLGTPASTDNTGYYMQFSEVEVYSGGKRLWYHPTVSSNMNYGTLWNLDYINDGEVSATGHLGYTTQKFSSANQHVWLTLDFGADTLVDKLVLYPRQDDHANGNDALVANYPQNFTLQSSSDGQNYTTLMRFTGAAPTWRNNATNVPYIGRNFTLNKPVKSARLYATALGVYTLHINGKPVTQNKLEPGESEYEKTVLYSSYDVTPLLKQGSNAIIAQVSGGLYDVQKLTGRFSKGEINNSGNTALLSELIIRYTDGSCDTLLTDNSWRYTASPTLGSNWWGGEDYDARMQIADIDSSHVDMDGWLNVTEIQPAFKSSQASGFGQLRARSYEPLQVVEQWKGVKVSTVHSGGYTLQVVDFGRNFAGQYRFHLKGKPGQTITLREGESLNADGSVFMENYYTGPADTYETYTFRGDNDGEDWGPEFMYHGFRYLQIIGLDEAPSPECFTAMRIRSNVDNCGKFTTSNTLINGIHTICRDAIASQLYNTITDCPHREKLGWLDVPNEMFNSLTYNFDMRQFFHKVVRDCFDAQYADGHVPSTVPHYMSVYDNDPNWGGAAILVPYRCWKTYGDTTLLTRYYKQMKSLMNYYVRNTTNGIMNNISVLSDWGQETAGVNPLVTTEFTITTTYYYMLNAMSQMAALLGQNNDSAFYASQAAITRTAFNNKFYKGNGIYGNGQQAEQAMPLYYGLVDDDQRADVARKLAERVKQDGYKIKTGEIGLKPVLMSLAQYGYNSIVFRMSQQTDCPSYGYWVVNGYTTTPEYWNVGAFSQNHCMMDHIEEWFFGELGGIKNNGVAFNHISIKPYMQDSLRQMSTSFTSPYGLITSAYTKADSTYQYSFDVPANTDAVIEVELPANQKLMAGNQEVKAGVAGITSIAYNGTMATMKVTSGHYEFASGNPQTSAIRVVNTDSKGEPVFFDLQGIAHKQPLTQGVYIVDGKKMMARCN